jgi:hypothetical protein
VLLESPVLLARFPRAPAVAADLDLGVAAGVLPQGVGILTFGIQAPSTCLTYDGLFVVARAVVLETHERISSTFSADRGDYVRPARPGVLPVVLGGLGRVVGWEW